MVSGTWSEAEHINVLELRAIWLTMEHFLPLLQGATVEAMTDNTTAASYINREGGTHSRKLCRLALRFLEWCDHQRINVLATHIAGVSNVLADRALASARPARPQDGQSVVLGQNDGTGRS